MKFNVEKLRAISKPRSEAGIKSARARAIKRIERDYAFPFVCKGNDCDLRDMCKRYKEFTEMVKIGYSVGIMTSVCYKGECQLLIKY